MHVTLSGSKQKLDHYVRSSEEFLELLSRYCTLLTKPSVDVFKFKSKFYTCIVR